MKGKTTILAALLLIIFLYNCVPDKYPGRNLVLVNNSDSRIYYWYFREYQIYHFPDVSLPNIMPIGIFSVGPNNRKAAGPPDPNWQSIYEQLPGDKFTVYFFLNKPNTQEEWELLIDNPDDISRKDVTLDELQENDYVISYP